MNKIKKILVLLVKLAGYKGTFGTKVKVFFQMLPVIFKSKPKANDNKPHTVKFLQFKISGYRLHTIEYLLNEIFLSNEYWFVADNDKPVILDCGANIGVSIMYLSNLYPNAEITGFEANPFVFEALKKNLAANNINATVVNCALCNQALSIPFYLGDDPGSLTGSIINERGGQNKIDIEGQQLSKFVSKYEKIDLIKIDIEGAETEVIEDLYSKNLLAVADNYMIEFHHNIKNAKTDLPGFLRKFEENGFGYSIRTRYKTPGDFQDIFLHFYKN